MADLPQPYFDQSQYPAWFEAQRKQQLASMLMGSLQQSNQTPENWDSMKVVPRRGMLQNVSVLANALLAGKAQKDANSATLNYLSPHPTPTGPGAGIVSQDAPQDAQDAAQAVTNTPPRSGLVPQQSPLIPAGMSRNAAVAAWRAMGPDKYFEHFVAPNIMGTPEWQTALRANNGDAQAAMQQLQAEARVKSTMHMRQAPTGFIFE